jgi:alkane 1-monooxygenase
VGIAQESYFCLFMARNYLYIFSLIPTALNLIGNLNGGYLAGTNIAFTFLFLGLVEWFSGTNTSNNHSEENSKLPIILLYLHVIGNTLVVASLVYGIYSGILSEGFVIMAAISTGIHTATSAVVISHELIHKSGKLPRAMGKYLLAIAGNVYFYIHHLRIHHRYVATDHDAASARYNESLYSFIGRSISGQLTQAWESEAQLVRKSGKSTLSINHYMVRAILVQLIIMLSITWFLGYPGLLAWLINIVIAAIMLEYVNYIEHYGLQRKENQQVNAQHSWNCNKYISRFLLVDLSRHADHHLFANKSYHTLQTHDEAPTLPGGYAALIVPAFIPPIWRALVHPILHKWHKNNELRIEA